MKSSGNFLTTNQVAKRLGIKRSDDISALIRKNKFPNAIKTGKSWRIPLQDVIAYESYSDRLKHSLDIKQTAKRLDLKVGRMPGLIARSVFPNAFKYNGKWWIPEKNIKSIEFLKNTTLTIKQASEELKNISPKSIRNMIHEGLFPNAFKDFAWNWRIPKNDIKKYINKIGYDTVSIRQAKTLLKYESEEIVNRLLHNNSFPNAYKFHGKWRIPISDINEHVKTLKKTLNTRQTMERLGYGHPFSVIQLIEKSILPNAFKYHGKWRIPLTDIERIEKTQSEALDTTDTAKRLGESSNALISEMIRKGKFPNAFKDKLSMWRIPLEDIEDYEKENDIEHHINVKDAATLLGYKSTAPILALLRDGKFPNAFKSKKKWWIHKKDLSTLKDQLDTKRNSIKKIQKNKTKSKVQKDEAKSKIQKRLVPLKNDPNLQGYIGFPAIQKKLNLSRYQINSLFHKGVFSETMKYRGKWWVTKNSFEKYQSEIVKQENQRQNTLSVSEAADRLGYEHVGSISGLINKDKRFPNAFKIGNHWHIPVEDIKEFENKRLKENKKVNFTPEFAYGELIEFIDTIEIKDNFRETKELFIQYSLLQINNMSGSDTYRRDRILLYKRFYNKLVNELGNEIFLVSMPEIEKMLHERSSFKKGEKKVLIPFLRYVFSQKDMNPDLEFSLLSTNNRTKEKDIYPPKLFHEIYQYVKMLNTHMPLAIKDRYYANMWVYSILLLTDFIRGQDLIMNTPSVNLEAIDITSFDWFTENELSDHESQLIINQLYLHFRNKRTSKTDELLTFIVAPDLVRPLAHALAISELHRKVEGSELLLDTFLSGVYNRTETRGKMRHKRFFEKMEKEPDFKFSSLKMNRTVATYLFYSITEEDGQDSDLALHLSQVSRSHKKADSTSRYIQSTNKDGSINRVSYNLFRRGHFGWLYNYLLLYVSQFENTQDSLEERSDLIEKTREEIAPHDLENMAEFVHNSLIPIDLKDQSNDMETFIQNVYNKKQSVISKLKSYSKEEIREIITNLAKGNLPSKNEGAQCLVYPDCKNPMLSSCFSCEYVIPGNSMLIQLNEELKRLINNLKDLTNEVIIKRESMFLMHAMLIWKEARIAFGEDKVNAYIPMKETWQEIEGIAGKLSIDK